MDYLNFMIKWFEADINQREVKFSRVTVYQSDVKMTVWRATLCNYIESRKSIGIGLTPEVAFERAWNLELAHTAASTLTQEEIDSNPNISGA